MKKLISKLIEIPHYWDLISMLTLRDIRIRYKQAVMGCLWAIFMPVVAVLAGILVKKAMAVLSGSEVDLKGIISISVKVLPWTFFISAIRFGVQTLVSNQNLVTKIYFPRTVMPLAAILASLFDFSVAATALTILLIVIKIGVSPYLLLLPFVLLFLILFTSGVAFFLSASNLFYRDVKYIVEIILMFGIFFTPVFYSASSVGDWSFWLLINPLGSILEAVNQIIVLKEMPDMYWFSYAAVSSLFAFIAGLFFFIKKEPYFAENI